GDEPLASAALDLDGVAHAREQAPARTAGVAVRVPQEYVAAAARAAHEEPLRGALCEQSPAVAAQLPGGHQLLIAKIKFKVKERRRHVLRARSVRRGRGRWPGAWPRSGGRLRG